MFICFIYYSNAIKMSNVNNTTYTQNMCMHKLAFMYAHTYKWATYSVYATTRILTTMQHDLVYLYIHTCIWHKDATIAGALWTTIQPIQIVLALNTLQLKPPLSYTTLTHCSARAGPHMYVRTYVHVLSQITPVTICDLLTACPRRLPNPTDCPQQRLSTISGTPQLVQLHPTHIRPHTDSPNSHSHC